MKKGDQIPVNIAGDVVAQATIERVDLEANTVTMVFPATRVVMALRTEIDTTPAEPVETEPATQTIITGVDRVDAQGNIIEGKSTGEPAPVVESAPVSGNEGVAAGVEGSSPVPTPDGGTPEGDATQTQLVEPTPPVETVTSE